MVITYVITLTYKSFVILLSFIDIIQLFLIALHSANKCEKSITDLAILKTSIVKNNLKMTPITIAIEYIVWPTFFVNKGNVT